MFASVGLFYLVGCATLVTRSGYRRLDRYKVNEQQPDRKNTLPEWLYEYLPYCYFAFATVMLLKTSLPSLQFLAFFNDAGINKFAFKSQQSPKSKVVISTLAS
ncbi:MAG: hypothetical protein ACJASU_001905 [Cognaticolwellia sp.]